MPLQELVASVQLLVVEVDLSVGGRSTVEVVVHRPKIYLNNSLEARLAVAWVAGVELRAIREAMSKST